MSEPVDYDTFALWVKDRFGEFKERDGKIRLNSIFCDDIKFHLYCKPSIGFFKCMKSGKKGPLYELIKKVDNCSYEEAIDVLGGSDNIRYLESKLEEFLNPKKEEIKEVIVKLGFQLPENTFRINELHPNNHFRKRAENYLAGRKLPINALMICIGGKHYNRIVIPYFNRDGDLVYWNARDISGLSKQRYAFPDANSGAKKDEVVWMQYFPKKGSTVYLTEGEFDAMSLNECGLHGAAFGGKDVNYKQIECLKGWYNLVIAFDADSAGVDGLIALGNNLMGMGFNEISYVTPPKPYKDWNEMLKNVDKNVMYNYIKLSQKDFNEWTAIELKNNNVFLK